MADIDKALPNVETELKIPSDEEIVVEKSKTTEEISKAAGGFGIPGFKWPL